MKWVLLLVVVSSAAAGDLLQRFALRTSPVRWFLLAVAMASMAISFFAFLKLLSRTDLSFAVPATAATLVLETSLARLLLKERVDGRRWAGASLVAAGVLLLAG
ncbi:MAG: EamA family transporter [Bryobacteraceae bacterium]